MKPAHPLIVLFLILDLDVLFRLASFRIDPQLHGFITLALLSLYRSPATLYLALPALALNHYVLRTWLPAMTTVPESLEDVGIVAALFVYLVMAVRKAGRESRLAQI